MKMERLIGILSILLQRDKVTAPELAEQFEVSRRTIQRDIESLCQAGIPIATAQGTGGGISILKGYRVDRTVLTTPEMQAILAGLQSLDSVSGTRRYAQLMEKLSAGSGSRDSHILIDLSSWYKTSLSPKIEAIHSAIRQHLTIRFTYFSPRETAVRTIEPYDLVFQWSSWYVWGWCQTRQDFRLFKLNRMTDLALGEPFTPRPAPPPVQPPRRGGRRGGQGGPRRREPGPLGAAGRLRFTWGFPDADSVLSWVLTFGEGAELTEPEELRLRLAALTATLVRRYQKEV